MDSQPAVELRGVTKRYAGHPAVRDLNLVVPRGSIYGLLGPNGAGKTTTIRMILGIIEPDEGSIGVLGNQEDRWQAVQNVGYLPEERGLYRKMKILDILSFFAETKGVGRSVAQKSAVAWLDRLGLSGWSNHKVDDLSKGMQQKVQFIAALLHGPQLLILDEPFAGLDPVNAQVLKDTVREVADAGTTVVFSTHQMDQAERLCDSVCIIARGQKVVDGPLHEVKRSHRSGGEHVVVELAEGSDGADRLFADPALVARADCYGKYAEIELAKGCDSQKLLHALVEIAARITRFEVAEPSLNKIFLDRVGGDASVAAISGNQ